MKWIIRIFATLVLLVVLITAGLSLYLTDARLTALVMPPLKEALGDGVKVDNLGYTFFSTFPEFGLVIEGLSLDSPEGEPVMRLASLRVVVPVRPLFTGQVDVTSLHLDAPELSYIVREDGTTNLDFLMSAESDTTAADTSSASIRLDAIHITQGKITYDDRQSVMSAELAGLDLSAAIRLGDVIESDVDLTIAGLTFALDGATLIDSLPVSVTQTSVLDMTHELLELREGAFSIRGLALNTTGSISAWSGDSMAYRFDFASASDNFGALLDLVPDEYKDQIKGVETRGGLTLKGMVDGNLAMDMPTFDIVMTVTDGFLKHPSAPKSIEDVQIDLSATNALLTLNAFSARAETNTLSATGRVVEPFSDKGTFTLEAKANIDLGAMETFYPISDFGIVVSGLLNLNIAGNGRLDAPDAMKFKGGVTVKGVNVYTEDLDVPLKNMNGELVFNDANVELKAFTFGMGSSDVTLTGAMINYRNLMETVGSASPARLTATYGSRFLDVDEIYDINETNDDPLYMDLPNLSSTLSARIDSMVFVGIPFTQVQGKAVTTPKMLEMSEASARVFSGGMSGYVKWDIPQRDYTWITFRGDLTNVRSETFFKEFKLGGKSDFHQYISGGFTAKASFVTAMDAMLVQDAKTIQGNGTFGIDRARIKGHPTQVKISDLLGIAELKDVSLDAWTASFDIKDGLMTLRDMNLTSKDIGLNLNGTHNLVTDRINYKIHIALPASFGTRVERLLTKDGVEALKNANGVIVIPMSVTGTLVDPSVGLDQEFVKNAIREYLKKKGTDAAGRLLQGIIRN